ncbi:MAG: translation elongation factor 4 [bacterium]|jgi:GTP-binding protein LepA
MDKNLIRNFCIVAHIDHGKSTLADRLLEMTGTVSAKDMREQVLDNMPLERERGITIKSHAITMEYPARDGRTYELNLIDTPGHVDFTYEVSRSLAACEGALVLVDASQGIEAQTLSNLYMALDNDLAIIPALNKIDMKAARVAELKEKVSELLGVDESEILEVSAKEGRGVREILEAMVERIPHPEGDSSARLSALIFDSSFDQYRGAIAYVRVFEGTLQAGMKVRLMAKGTVHEVQEVGVFRLGMSPRKQLFAGEVGYMVAGIKNIADANVGDTVAEADDESARPLPGYREIKPMVYSGLYPTDGENFEVLREALLKLRLNDASLSYEPESSKALGFGFRCGFLGLLHMEIVQERLEREYDLNLIATVPSVRYKATLTDGSQVEVENPSSMPEAHRLETVEEPYVTAQVVTPMEFLDAVMRLVKERRGVYRGSEMLDSKRTLITCELPLAEILVDFHDRIKSISKGYASFDYDFSGYKPSDLVRLDILVNEEPVDALSVIVHRDRGYKLGKQIVEKLKDLIPRQLFQVVLQAAIGSRVISRETISPLKKNVTAKCYGGDITRKRKLLERQREGKRRMKSVGRVTIPQEAFLYLLKVDR